MADYVRRHSLLLSDSEIKLVDRTLLVYATLLQIMAKANSKRERAEIGHIMRATQSHFACKCPVPEGVS